MLPTSLLQEHKIVAALQSQRCVKQIVIGKKNGCMPMHDSMDVTSIQVRYHTAPVNPTEVTTNAFQKITESHVQEAQFRGFPPWKNTAFENQHCNGLDLTIIDY